MAVIENIVAAVSDQRNDSAQEQVYLAVFGERVQCALAHQPVVCMVIDGFHLSLIHISTAEAASGLTSSEITMWPA